MTLALIAAFVTAKASGAAEYCFGYYELRDGTSYAAFDEAWTFDHDAPDPLEGWTPQHYSGPDDREVIRWRVTEDFENDNLPPGAPVINGNGMIWAGVHSDEAEELCFECGLGYGPGWSQMLRSPLMAYSGEPVFLSFDYFMDADDFYVELVYGLLTESGVIRQSEVIEPSGETWNQPATLNDQFQFSGSDSVALVIGVTTGRYDHDEDCSFDSEFGALGVDNIVLSGGLTASFDFEGTDHGWENQILGTPPGFHVSVTDLESYGRGWESWQGCPVEENVLTFHDLEDGFSDPFFEGAVSPIVDLTPLDLQSIDSAVFSVDVFHDYPDASPPIDWFVQLRTFPIPCPRGGDPKWSQWGVPLLAFNTPGAECFTQEVDILPQIPSGVEAIQVRLSVRHCSGCCIQTCPDEDDVTPFFDNLQICVAGQTASDAPEVSSNLATESLGIRVVPNPATADSRLQLSVKRPLEIELSLYDAAGRVVSPVLSGTFQEGTYEVPLDARLEPVGQGLAVGVYFVRGTADGAVYSRKILLRRE